MTTWHLLTGEYPPNSGGVGDYTRALACEIGRRGHAVHVWSPSAMSHEDGIAVHTLPDVFGARSRSTLTAAWDALPSTLLLQYVPNALGARGLNLPFCRWLRRSGHGRDLRVMFHEPYFYFSWNPVGNVRAAVQRSMARTLVDASRRVYVSTDTWRRYLPASRPMTVLPIPSTIPRCGHEAAARFRCGLGMGAEAEVAGHFGTYGDHVARELDPVVPLVLEGRPFTRFLCIGKRSDRYAMALRARHPQLADRIHHTGELPASDAAAAIRACDVMVQPYPDGVTTRRTSVMAPLANGVATVSTIGELTEAVWVESGAVALAPAGASSAIAERVIHLLGDSAERAALSAAGGRTYDAYFSIEKSVDTLLASR